MLSVLVVDCCKATGRGYMWAKGRSQVRLLYQPIISHHTHTHTRIHTIFLTHANTSAHTHTLKHTQGQIDAACAQYEGLLNAEKAKDGEGGSKLYPFLAVHYANFLKQVQCHMCVCECVCKFVGFLGAKFHSSAAKFHSSVKHEIYHIEFGSSSRLYNVQPALHT